MPKTLKLLSLRVLNDGARINAVVQVDGGPTVVGDIARPSDAEGRKAWDKMILGAKFFYFTGEDGRPRKAPKEFEWATVPKVVQQRIEESLHGARARSAQK